MDSGHTVQSSPTGCGEIGGVGTSWLCSLLIEYTDTVQPSWMAASYSVNMPAGVLSRWHILNMLPSLNYFEMHANMLSRQHPCYNFGDKGQHIRGIWISVALFFQSSLMSSVNALRMGNKSIFLCEPNCDTEKEREEGAHLRKPPSQSNDSG